MFNYAQCRKQNFIIIHNQSFRQMAERQRRLMLDKLDAIKGRFDNLGVALTNPEIVSDNKKFAATSKEYRSLEKIVNARDEYVRLLDDIEFNKESPQYAYS